MPAVVLGQVEDFEEVDYVSDAASRLGADSVSDVASHLGVDSVAHAAFLKEVFPVSDMCRALEMDPAMDIGPVVLAGSSLV